ncbi:MAG: proline--tRNA ligase [Calditrichaeota bacterium]|nr:proline--tRNA ligase [Calditrichota bacterium]
MLRSQYFAPTLKETPSDAVATSHKLLLRAGLVRPLSAGIWTFLPLGWRAARKAEQIVREEMERIGGQEFHFPALNPIDIWNETGRATDFGEELFRLTDRKGRINCLAPTHEEVVCATARGEIRSWRDLPQIWFQIQTKFRDEPRPRGGMLRMRQFIMKDSYSLDRDEEGLDRSYDLHRQAYERIFQRAGLDYFIVGASSGLMGGAQSQEFMVESDAGEDTIARCPSCGYAANIEVASSVVEKPDQGEAGTLNEVATPGQRTVDEVSAYLQVHPSRMVKTLIFATGSGPLMALVAGDDEISEAKLMKAAGGLVRPAHPDEVREWLGVEVGYIGPHGNRTMPVYADLRLEDAVGMITGANRADHHVSGLDLARDARPDEYVDLRVVREGEGCPVCGQGLRLIRAIELGHIFKLGTKYSSAMGAVYLDESGGERPIVMGSYGIGIERILAAAVEGQADGDGIRWNSALTPVDAVIIPLGSGEDDVTRVAGDIEMLLEEEGLAVLLDDRDARAGVKMKDADLMGAPAQVIVSPRNLASGTVELKNRWTGARNFVDPSSIAIAVEEILEECRPMLRDEAD